MRKLVILRGAMGAGKTTFVETHDLKKYTICVDDLRLLFNAPELGADYKESIPQFNNKKVWELVYSLLESRMQKGEFTIVDAVHAKIDESFSKYKRLAEKYRYRMYIIDFTGIPKEEVLQRNESREEYKKVPEYAIERAYKTFAKEKTPSYCTVLAPEEFETLLNTTPRVLDDYNKIHLIGDIHGCYTALRTYFDEHPQNEDEFYIFLGDYFDRGLENGKTFRYLTELISKKNVVFLIGNHEDRLYKYACDDEFKMDYDIEKTIEEFASANITKSELRGFIKRLSQISHFTFRGKTYLATHGGIPYIPDRPLDFYSTNSFIYGTQTYETDIDKIYDEFMANKENKVYQIHAHRNFYKYEMDEYPHSFNLEGDIEHGGHLRILTLESDGTYSCEEIQNDVYDANLKEHVNVYDLIENLRKNKYVFEKELSCGISSFNFSKEAFYNRIWNDMTTKARGLFIDTNKKKIIARSYNKFFKIGERRETELEALSSSISFPVHFYLKYNGFLGILSAKDGELFFASKSTDEGKYVDYFTNIFYSTYTTSQIGTLKDKIEKENLTAVFEVVDPTNDPHIIEYAEPKIVLLDMIKNETAYSKISYADLKEFASHNEIEVKEEVYTADDWNAFAQTYEMITKEDYTLDEEFVEGFVIEDSTGFMVKTKTHYYDTWKRLRAKMEKALKDKNFACQSKDELERDFMSFIGRKYENVDYDLERINIIAERQEFEREAN